ncbi:MAG: hypothetical protein K0S65_5991 [Labilithrix sp.]|nr:hypothetical protein [Labilithrix sp.]
MSAGKTTPPLPEDLRARILAEVKRTSAPTRREHRTRVVVLSAIGTLTTIALFFAAGGFAMGARPMELVVFLAGSGLLVALILTRLAAGFGGSMLGRPRQVLLLCVGAAPVLALLALAAAACWPSTATEKVPPSVHLTCALITTAQAVLPLLTLLVPRRGSDPVHPALAGAAIGMTAGAWSAMMAYLRCPDAAAFHCIVAHVVPTLVLTAAGALFGRSLLKIR